MMKSIMLLLSIILTICSGAAGAKEKNDNIIGSLSSDSVTNMMPAMEMDEPVGFVLYSKDITGRQVVFKPQEDYQCFSRDDWARMAHLINDYHWLWDYSIGMNIIASKYQEQIGDLKLQVSNWEKMADRMNESRLMVGDLLKKEEKYKRIELKSAKINKALMWTSVVLAAIEAGVIGALSAMQASE